ncbi:hypothetical protein C8N35_1011293 [Breoghania corrubedonensis]|uniref:DUF1127 domain-containing protein n=1 Tax=Breoghania corrubedonensis TaxID=665038 RepID=A0A2T5VHL2_9HYPH|nr:hypothetical protein [Breoghania corrubedonensis]PTW63242.1 hypothetical protein C8N35_1011293 [Breoghania corrubedonensis]
MVFRSFLGSVLGVFDDIQRAGRANATYHKFSMMSDDELARRGINRGDVMRVALRSGFGDL